MIWTKLTRTDTVFSRATSVVFFCAGFRIFRYAGKIPKKYIKNQRSRSFTSAKGGEQGSQGVPRRVHGAAQPLAAPGTLLGGSHTPWCPNFALFLPPREEIPEQKFFFRSTPRSRRHPLFFLGRANLEAVLAFGEGKSSPSSSSSPLHHPSMTSSLMCE